MRLRWTQAAADDLEIICDYLHEHHPTYAQATVSRIHREILALRKYPRRGRIGVELGTRELILADLPYIIVFRATDLAVEVLRIHHGAQDWQ
jgi:plasmid stabilization system protein ParE